MSIDPTVLSSIAASVSLLGTEYLKGTATEAGKSTWGGIKSLFGWCSDPDPMELSAKVADTLAVSPELVEKVLQLLKRDQASTAAQLVGNIDARDSKVVVANSVETLNM